MFRIRYAGGLIVAVALGCAEPAAERVRTVTYPRDFHYITQQEIRTAMGELAHEIVMLEQQLSPRSEGDGVDQVGVVQILSRMDRVAASLKRREHSNHPRIDAYAPRLRRDIERALVGARSDPPSYVAAGRVSGACSYCHAPRHGDVPSERSGGR